jgi:hypothetical protein
MSSSHSSRKSSRSSKNRNHSKSTQSSTDRAIAQSATVVGRANVEVPALDFVRSMPSWQLTQTPPRSIRNQLYWLQGKTSTTVSISNSVPTQANVSFQLADLTDIVGLSGFFDQYCIYSVTVNVTPDFEGAGSTLYTFGSVATAIDYDNVGTLGALHNILAFGSCVVNEMTSGQSLQRYIKPCVAPALFNSSAAFSGYGVGRLWVDSSDTSVPHYGFRSFFTANTVSGLSVTLDCNYVVGFRNNV